MPRFALTPAEKAVNALLIQGLSNRSIAKELNLSVRTVESHISHSLLKTGCLNRVQLVLWLLKNTAHQSVRASR